MIPPILFLINKYNHILKTPVGQVKNTILNEFSLFFYETYRIKIAHAFSPV